jgi:hypothetical protein
VFSRLHDVTDGKGLNFQKAMARGTHVASLDDLGKVTHKNPMLRRVRGIPFSHRNPVYNFPRVESLNIKFANHAFSARVASGLLVL